MNDVVDYALQQGDDFGVFLWFAILTLSVILSVILVIIMAFQIIKGIYVFIKNTFNIKKFIAFLMSFLLGCTITFLIIWLLVLIF